MDTLELWKRATDMRCPFDEATVLSAGHACEQATAWRAKRPQLAPGAAQPPVTSKGNGPEARADLDARTRGLALDLAARAGLKLNERRQAIVLEAAPHALAMAERIRKDRNRFEEPALVFRFPDSGRGTVTK